MCHAHKYGMAACVIRTLFLWPSKSCFKVLRCALVQTPSITENYNPRERFHKVQYWCQRVTLCSLLLSATVKEGTGNAYDNSCVIRKLSVPQGKPLTASKPVEAVVGIKEVILLSLLHHDCRSFAFAQGFNLAIWVCCSASSWFK